MSDERFLGPTERMLYFTSLPSARALGIASIVVIAEHASEFRAKKGTVLVRPDEPADFVYFLVSGEVEMTWNGLSRRRSAPWTVGLEAVLTDNRTPRQAVAATDCVALSLPTAVLLDLLAFNPSPMASLLRQYARRRVQLEKGLPVVRELIDLGVSPGRPTVPETMRLLLHSTPGQLDFDGALALLNGLEYREVPAGHRLWRRRDDPAYVILLEGSVHFESDQAVRHIEGPHDFGLVTALAESMVACDAVMASPTRILIANPETVRSAVELGPGLSRVLLRELVAELMLGGS